MNRMLRNMGIRDNYILESFSADLLWKHYLSLSTGLLNKESIISQVPWWKNVMCSIRCKYNSHPDNI